MSEHQPAVQSRPRDVWVAGILLIVFGVLGTFVSLVLYSSVEDDRSHGVSVSSFVYGLVLASIVLAVAEAVSGVFVILGREWARIAAIAICALNALSGVITVIGSQAFQGCIGVLLNVALIVALNRDDVRTWCR
jgi:hypothetical protein